MVATVPIAAGARPRRRPAFAGPPEWPPQAFSSDRKSASAIDPLAAPTPRRGPTGIDVVDSEHSVDHFKHYGRFPAVKRVADGLALAPGLNQPVSRSRARCCDRADCESPTTLSNSLTQRSPSNNSHKISSRFSLANAFKSVAAFRVLTCPGSVLFTMHYRRFSMQSAGSNGSGGSRCRRCATNVNSIMNNTPSLPFGKQNVPTIVVKELATHLGRKSRKTLKGCSSDRGSARGRLRTRSLASAKPLVRREGRPSDRGSLRRGLGDHRRAAWRGGRDRRR